MNFSELNISPEILKAIEKIGFSEPTVIQAMCIPAICEGKDIIGRSQTGSGKTLAFGIPLLENTDPDLNAVQGLVVCPTRELAMQVCAEIRRVAEYLPSLRIVDVYGGADMEKQAKALKTAKIVVATPGRLKDHIRRKNLHLNAVKVAVLDEADEMLNMGFRDDIESILKACPRERQTVMFSATMPSGIKKIAEMHMKNPEMLSVGAENNTIKEIAQSYLVAGSDKKSLLVELFKKHEPKSAIIFTNTKRAADDINNHLGRVGIKSQALHGDMSQNERKRTINAMKDGACSVLVATDVAARGIDINDIDYVINYDLPQDVEYYIHRIGRTGRAGKSGNAVTLISDSGEFAKIKYYKTITGSEIGEHPLSKKSPYDMNRKSIPFARRGYRGR